MVMFDLDHFKEVNDNHGHSAGDKALQQVAHSLLNLTRIGDICGRYGGEEFVIILPDTDLASAKIFADRFRKLKERMPVTVNKTNISLTISVGIAEFSHGDEASQDWLDRAYKALYLAKQKGRNQVQLFTET